MHPNRGFNISHIFLTFFTQIHRVRKNMDSQKGYTIAVNSYDLCLCAKPAHVGECWTFSPKKEVNDVFNGCQCVKV